MAERRHVVHSPQAERISVEDARHRHGRVTRGPPAWSTHVLRREHRPIAARTNARERPEALHDRGSARVVTEEDYQIRLSEKKEAKAYVEREEAAREAADEEERLEREKQEVAREEIKKQLLAAWRDDDDTSS